MIGFEGACHYHESAGVAVEPVYHYRIAVVLVPTLAHYRLYALHIVLARHREHACRLVDNAYCVILVHYLQLFGCSRRERIGFYVEPLKHVRQYGQTLRTACGIIAQMMAYLLPWRFAPPEFSHAHGLESVAVGILQQLGCAAVASPSRRNCMRGGAEYVDEVALFATCVEHAVLREEPPLQFVAHAAAALSQCGYALVVLQCEGMGC